jgi:hypothetical protein
MLLTLNQILWIILTLAAVVAIIFLVLFLIQLRKTAREGELTLIEVRELVKDLRETEHKIDASVTEIGEVIRVSSKTIGSLSAITGYVTTGLMRSTLKAWAFALPALRWSWQRLKKRKEKQNGR